MVIPIETLVNVIKEEKPTLIKNSSEIVTIVFVRRGFVDIGVVFEDVFPEAVPARTAKGTLKKTTTIYKNVEGQTDGR